MPATRSSTARTERRSDGGMCVVFDEDDLPAYDPVNADNFGIGCGCGLLLLIFAVAIVLLGLLLDALDRRADAGADLEPGGALCVTGVE